MPTAAMFGNSLGIALGSICEVMCHLDIAYRVGALTQAQYERFYDEARQIRAMLIVFRRRILRDAAVGQ
jgi:four helix bundle protein